ncbi:hypothetical protein ADK86_24050 [Streptomyces sp. NRRL F-5755]|uniref:hypothetical protein n=1 Tax=Streptomyces sp. NRRL F-5755 TaxID=1519475 RepID=UPI0006AFF0C4|nr:hypothetical protein [Streptomyces sp. NRRL F-5755]KOT91056.1 hypothetical protein ADK86_24050 [Streptomyces sp. NRRL F-5755]
MPNPRPLAACVKSPDATRPLSDSEAVVVIVITVLSGTMAAIGLPLSEVLQLLSGASLIAVLVLRLLPRTGRSARTALRALLAFGSQG